MKKILVPSDFSETSNEAFQFALALAAKTRGEIVLVHVLAIPTLYTVGFAGEPSTFDPIYYQTIEAESKKELEKLKASAKGVNVSTQVIYGDFPTSLTSIVESKRIDLIIMGTSGASGWKEFFVGSNTEKVVRFSPAPVLAVRKAIDPNSIKSILLPSTLDLNQTEFVTKLQELQNFFNATIHVLLVNTPTHFRRDTEAREAMEEFAKHYKLKEFKLHFRNARREEDGIIDFAIKEKMDMIAMATHARKGLAHLFNESIAENVVNHIHCPIWTYHVKV